MKRQAQDSFFDLPEFDTPQKDPPPGTQWSYEQAVRAFEKLAAALKLRREPRPRRGASEKIFEL